MSIKVPILPNKEQKISMVLEIVLVDDNHSICLQHVIKQTFLEVILLFHFYKNLGILSIIALFRSSYKI